MNCSNIELPHQGRCKRLRTASTQSQHLGDREDGTSNPRKEEGPHQGDASVPAPRPRSPRPYITGKMGHRWEWNLE
jgi:hypothetical protein